MMLPTHLFIITSIFLPDTLTKSHHPWDVTPGILLPYFLGIFPLPFYPVACICACLFNKPQQTFNLSSNSPQLETIVDLQRQQQIKQPFGRGICDSFDLTLVTRNAINEK